MRFLQVALAGDGWRPSVADGLQRSAGLGSQRGSGPGSRTTPTWFTLVVGVRAMIVSSRRLPSVDLATSTLKRACPRRSLNVASALEIVVSARGTPRSRTIAPRTRRP